MIIREIRISCLGLTMEDKEVLIASLFDFGFEGFIEEDDFMNTYIPAEYYKDSHSEFILTFFHSRNLNPNLLLSDIQDKNWNLEWEKNFKPVIIDNQCAVKASFHKIPDNEYNIIIDPEMSFGTGHHETTRMMIRHILDVNPNGKDVLDVGCGTGVLGILARMMGAATVTGIDIDENAYKNSLDNFKKNNISEGYHIIMGDISLLHGTSFDIILANINRNIILNDIQDYYNLLRSPGLLIISGLLLEDEKIIRQAGENSGLHYINTTYKNKWISLKLKR